MELIKKLKSFVGIKSKIKIIDPNTIENLQLLILENLDFKKDIKEKTDLIKKMQVHIENQNIVLDELETRVVTTERQLKEATGKPLNMDKVAAYLNHKNFKFETDGKGNNIWKQKPQIKKPKKKKINWDALQLVNDPSKGLSAKLKTTPQSIQPDPNYIKDTKSNTPIKL
tara:strand:- start:287 stop:796 length:510 start_codon:yes stop_codon:yes gene_type:complete